MGPLTLSLLTFPAPNSCPANHFQIPLRFSWTTTVLLCYYVRVTLALFSRAASAIMASHRAVLLTPSSRLVQPTKWSYLQIGTKPPLKSFACHSYENCRGVGVFFPFWNSTPPLPAAPNVPTFGRFDLPTLFVHSFHSKALVNAQFATSLFSISSALICTILHPPKNQPLYFQSFAHSLSIPPGVGGTPTSRLGARVPPNHRIRPGEGV